MFPFYNLFKVHYNTYTCTKGEFDLQIDKKKKNTILS